MFRNVSLTILPMALLGMLAMSSATRAETPQTHFQAPGFYRMMLGKDEITVLSDGTAPRSVDEIMSKPEVVRRALAAAHEDLPLQLSINSFLINKAGRLILVDTGAGELFGAHSGGLLLANLRAAGYGAERIDAVLLTHIHGDHSGGLSIGGKRLFPNATVYVDRRDVDFWLGADAEKAHPSLVRTIRQSHATLDPYVAAGRLHPFDGAGEPLPGIRAIPAHGHTPGHTAYLIESEGRKLLLWGDTIHLAEAQFDDPSISIEYDVNREEAVASRRALLAEAADQGYLVGAAHISFPGLGHVRRDAGGYGWAPAPYDAGQ